ncbi:autotransporter outer membrane beta-barrel domain-containing protein [Succinispira mobilis]
MLGVTGKINDNSEGYLNVEKLFGGDVSSNWQINIGCRYSF